ncbi:MAG: Gfo/Idh/MocA family oxidoreductase [Planctomycetes bacterium]|nr:Gfo/Idh/MocA family oxidoreductase [Planctomycetota bacterium]
MVNFGIIGCGGMGRHHTKSLQAIEGARVAACADANAEAARELAAACNIPDASGDYRRVLDRKDVDAVFVCTPTFTHREIVVAAAQAGKQIFCEKPLALTVDDCQAMIAACDAAGVQLMVGFVRRFDNQWCKVRELVQAGAIGRPVVWRQCNAGSCPKSPWYMFKDQGAGPLMDGAVHTYDFARYIFGDASAAWADLTRLRRDRTAWDTGTVSVRFQGGDSLGLSWSWGLPSGVSGGSILDVLGPDGVMLFSTPPDRLPKDCPPEEFGAISIVREGGTATVAPFRRNNLFADMVAAYVKALADGQPVPVPAETGLKATEIACAVFASSEQHRCVEIP